MGRTPAGGTPAGRTPAGGNREGRTPAGGSRAGGTPVVLRSRGERRRAGPEGNSREALRLVRLGSSKDSGSSEDRSSQGLSRTQLGRRCTEEHHRSGARQCLTGECLVTRVEPGSPKGDRAVDTTSRQMPATNPRLARCRSQRTSLVLGLIVRVVLDVVAMLLLLPGACKKGVRHNWVSGPSGWCSAPLVLLGMPPTAPGHPRFRG